MSQPHDEKDDALLFVVGGIGGYIVAAAGDRLVVYRGRTVARSRLVDGLGAFLSANPGQVRLRLAKTPDAADVLALVAPDGFGWTENLADPSCSEWGYCG